MLSYTDLSFTDATLSQSYQNTHRARCASKMPRSPVHLLELLYT